MKNVFRTWIALLASILFFVIGTATSIDEELIDLNAITWEDSIQLFIVNQDTFDYIDARLVLTFMHKDSLFLDSFHGSFYLCDDIYTILEGDTLVIEYGENVVKTCYQDTVTAQLGPLQALYMTIDNVPDTDLQGVFSHSFE